MKVLVIGFTKIAYMPYMHFYMDQLQKSNCEISLLYWDRDGKPDIDPPKGVEVHRFFDHILDSEPLAKKLPRFIKYRNYAKRIISNNKFDLIIVLHSTPGVLLYDILTKKYPGMYILDYRDVTYENIGVYKKIVHRLVGMSAVTYVSSNAFRKYLPGNCEIYTTHNLLMDSINNRDLRRKTQRVRDVIRVRYWGFIRHEKMNIDLIEALASDNRFELHYHGREQMTALNLKQYCKARKIKNVYFHGEYKPLDRYVFAADTDLIHNTFENDKTMQPAMSNKFYDGVVFYIPQVCNEGSYMGEEVTKSGVGISLNPNEECYSDKLYDYYQSINWTVFDSKCDEKLSKIVEEYDLGIYVLQDILSRRKV